MLPERQLARVTDYKQLMDALRARVRELDVTLETIDAVAGFHSNYSGKLLAPTPIRTLGRLSLGALLQSLGLALIVVEDPAALKRVESRLTKRRRPPRDARADDRDFQKDPSSRVS
jgi:hypothetical protein